MAKALEDPVASGSVKSGRTAKTKKAKRGKVTSAELAVVTTSGSGKASKSKRKRTEAAKPSELSGAIGRTKKPRRSKRSKVAEPTAAPRSAKPKKKSRPVDPVHVAVEGAQRRFPPPAELEDLVDPAGRPSRAERRAAGLLLRDEVALSSHGDWVAADDRPDPIDLLELQATTRVPELVPIRYGRMMSSPFAYFRGTPIVMAADLAGTPETGVHAQICGDAHLMNFGLFATPERNLIFDVNDFDETLPGPWEWDVKRLAASVVVAGFENGMSREDAFESARLTMATYAKWMDAYAGMGNLELWYAKVDSAAIDQVIRETGRDLNAAIRQHVDTAVAKAAHRTNAESLPKLTEVIDGRRRLVDDPPLIHHLPRDTTDFAFLHGFQLYRQSLRSSLRVVLDRYAVADMARKVVGVGSVGTRCYVVLMLGADGNDPLFLQVKEAERSVLERHLPQSEYANHGKRVVVGQRIMQAASDMFLGWTVGPDDRHFYVRQLRDMKGGARAERLADIETLSAYGSLCAWTLARAHACSGDQVVIAGYLGDGEEFADATARFALAYADQNLVDYERFVASVKNGRLFATPGY